MNETIVPLGSTVRDLTTGIEGVVTARTVWQYNCPRLVVQPRGVHPKSGGALDASHVDEPQVKVLKPPTKDLCREYGHPTIGLGAKVKDRVSGASGVVIAYTQYVSGCDHVLVQPTEVKEGSPCAPWWISTMALDVLNPTLTDSAPWLPEVPAVAAPVKPAPKSPAPNTRGGPCPKPVRYGID